jgi:hypothetical protein
VALAEYVDCEVVDAFTDWHREVWGDSILVARKPQRDASARHRFAVRSWMQRALLSSDVTSLPPMPNATEDEPHSTVLAPVRSGDLVAELQRIRDAHLAAEAEAARIADAAALDRLAEAVARAAHETTGPPSALAVTYGRFRASVAAMAGPRGRRAYKRLLGRS